jgi:hypothetical protein
LAKTVSLGFLGESLEWGVVFGRNELEVRVGAIEGKKGSFQTMPPSFEYVLF